MPAQNDTELIQFEDWTLRVRPAAIQPRRLLLLIHGFKGDENSMWVFARDLRPDYWIMAPRAPHAVDDGGYAWRPPRSGTSSRPGLEMFKPGLHRLMHLVDSYSASIGLAAVPFDALGFSQGAAVVNLIALLFPERIRKAGILAGFVPEGVESLAANRPLADKQFFVAHGARDETIPIERARQSIALLEEAGAQITYCEDQVGHKLSAGCLRSLKTFLKD